MKVRLLAAGMLVALPLTLSGCLYGRGPAGDAGNVAVRKAAPLEALLAAGRQYLDKEQPNDAFIVFKRAVALDAKSYDAQLGLARACGELGESTVGLSAAEAAAALKPKEAAPLATAGRICAASWKLDQAEEHYQGAVKLDPQNADAWRDLGRVRLRRAAIAGGSVSDAIAALEKARDLDKENAEGHALLAEAYVHVSRYESAIQEYTRAVALDSKNADYPRNLAWLLIMQGKALDQARDLALKSDRLQRGDGDALVAAAVALLRQGHTEDALNELRDAVGKANADPDVYFFLAQAAARRGRPEDLETAVSALQYLQQMRVPPRHASQKELEDLLEQIRAGLRRMQTGSS
jgi:Tfp pilus assembly protein PilF